MIIFTPAYDSYAPMIRRAGGTPVEVALRPPQWRIDQDSLQAAVTARTCAILFNNPQNPTGRLFDAAELEAVASVARKHDLLVIADEVWEHVVLDGARFVPIASLDEMAQRTIKVGSAGKIFSLTGWKVGMDRRGARARRGRGASAPVSDLLDGAQSPVRRRLWLERRQFMASANARPLPTFA